ncbi:hypothetical protein ACFL2J_07840, partial [Candidatus Omnitrophota bacterium]
RIKRGIVRKGAVVTNSWIDDIDAQAYSMTMGAYQPDMETFIAYTDYLTSDVFINDEGHREKIRVQLPIKQDLKKEVQLTDGTEKGLFNSKVWPRPTITEWQEDSFRYSFKDLSKLFDMEATKEFLDVILESDLPGSSSPIDDAAAREVATSSPLASPRSGAGYNKGWDAAKTEEELRRAFASGRVHAATDDEAKHIQSYMDEAVGFLSYEGHANALRGPPNVLIIGSEEDLFGAYYNYELHGHVVFIVRPVINTSSYNLTKVLIHVLNAQDEKTNRLAESRYVAMLDELSPEKAKRTFSNIGSVLRVWSVIRSDIEAVDPEVDQKETPFLSRLYHALKRTFIEIAQKAANGQIDPFALFDTRKFGKEVQDRRLHDLDRPLNIGFLAITANPINWGHILVVFMAMNALDLDAVVMRTQGEIAYKKLPESDRVPVKDRHELSEVVFGNLFPLLRRTDLGSEPNNDIEGFEELIRLLEMNEDRKINIFNLIGIENEERVQKYGPTFYEITNRLADRLHSVHGINIGWIQRGEYGARITQEEIDGINTRFQEEAGAEQRIPMALIKDPDIDLNVSSTYYRNSHDAAIVPHQVDEHARAHGYYGHPPIDPRTGKPFDYSEDELFKLKLRPITEGIAGEVVRRAERKGEDSSMVIGIDGASGSGKTTIAYEVGQFVEARGYKYVVISSDIFLKLKIWRGAVEKIVTGEELTEADREILGEVARKIAPNQTYFDEEDFWRNEGVLKILREIDEFRRTGEDRITLSVLDAYVRGGDPMRQDIEFEIEKGMIIIVDGKYVMREELQEFFDIRYRLYDNPDRTMAKFEMRTRSLNPNSADRQMKFYDAGMVPSFIKYEERTQDSIDYFIDVSGDEETWKLVSSADRSSSPVSKEDFVESIMLARILAEGQNCEYHSVVLRHVLQTKGIRSKIYEIIKTRNYSDHDFYGHYLVLTDDGWKIDAAPETSRFYSPEVIALLKGTGLNLGGSIIRVGSRLDGEIKKLLKDPESYFYEGIVPLSELARFKECRRFIGLRIKEVGPFDASSPIRTNLSAQSSSPTVFKNSGEHNPFVPFGIVVDPAWAHNREYSMFTTNPEWQVPDVGVLNDSLAFLAKLAPRRGVSLDLTGKTGLLFGFGSSYQQLRILREHFQLEHIKGVELNGDLVLKAASDLASAGFSPREYMLYHADFGLLKEQIEEGSIDLIYLNNITEFGEGTQEIAEILAYLLAPNGIILSSVGGQQFDSFLEQQGIIKNTSLASRVGFYQSTITTNSSAQSSSPTVAGDGELTDPERAAIDTTPISSSPLDLGELSIANSQWPMVTPSTIGHRLSTNITSSPVKTEHSKDSPREIVKGLSVKNGIMPMFDRIVDSDQAEVHIITAGGGGDILGGVFMAAELKQAFLQLGKDNIRFVVFTTNLKRGEENPKGGTTDIATIGIPTSRGNKDPLKRMGSSEYFYFIDSANTFTYVELEDDVISFPTKEGGIVDYVKDTWGFDIAITDISQSGYNLAKDYLEMVDSKQEEGIAVMTVGLDMGADILAQYPQPITEDNKDTHPERNVKSPTTDSISLEFFYHVQQAGHDTLLAVTAFGGDGELTTLINNGNSRSRSAVITEYLKQNFDRGNVLGVLDNYALMEDTPDQIEAVMGLNISSEVSTNFLRRLLKVVLGDGAESEHIGEGAVVDDWSKSNNYRADGWDLELCELMPSPYSGQRIRSDSRVEQLPYMYLYTLLLDIDGVRSMISESVRDKLSDPECGWAQAAEFFEEKFGYTTERNDHNNIIGQNKALAYLNETASIIRRFPDDLIKLRERAIRQIFKESRVGELSDYFVLRDMCYSQSDIEACVYRMILCQVVSKLAERYAEYPVLFNRQCAILSEFIASIISDEKRIMEALLVAYEIAGSFIPAVLEQVVDQEELAAILEELRFAVIKLSESRKLPVYEKVEEITALVNSLETISSESFKQTLDAYLNLTFDVKKEFEKLFDQEERAGIFSYERNALVHYWDRVRSIILGETVAPYEIEVQPSSVCNLDCRSCIGKEFRPEERIDVSSEAMDRFIDYILEHNKINRHKITRIKISGFFGEPLMAYGPTLSAVQKLISAGIDVGFFTNGLLLTEDVRRALMGVAYVHISLDADSGESF